jgi:undecaprenyl-phosphate 4-deoxy-4-formamido-L-arabinose transferase
VEHLEVVLERLHAGGWEIILVSDGSPDDTADVIRRELAGHERVLLVELNRNYGQHNAIMCGFSIARGEFVFTIDDDLQSPPEMLERLWQALGEHDVVYGVPARRQHKNYRNLGSSLINLYYRFIFKRRNRISSLRLLRRFIVNQLIAYQGTFVFIDGLIPWSTDRITTVEVEHRVRAHGKGGYSLRRLIRLSFNLFTNFTIFPLHLATFLGLTCALGSFGVGLYYLLKKFLWDIPVSGFTSTIVAITFLSGVQLLSLGIIGEYVGRLHILSNSKPQYHVRGITRLDVRDEGE